MATPRRPPRRDPLGWLDLDELRDHLATPDAASMDAGWWSGTLACATAGVDMFPEALGGVVKATGVCAGCEAVYPCLAYGLMTSAVELDFGVWGRTSKADRRKIRKRLAVPARRQLRTRGVAS